MLIKSGTYKRLTLLFVVLFTFSVLSCDINKKPENVKVYIVAVGLNYSATNLYLSFTCDDVVEFASYYRSILAEKGIESEVYYMLDSGRYNTFEGKWDIDSDVTSPYYPTVQNVKNVLMDIKEKVKPSDLVVFLYSGHGTESREEDENGNRIWSSDTNGAFVLRSVAKNNDETPTVGLSYLTPHDFVALLKEIPCYRAAVVDSCFSGVIVGKMLDGTDVGETLGSGGYEATGQTTWYNVSFSEINHFTKFGAVTAARASEESVELNPLFGGFSKNVFNGEGHGLMFGSIISGLGLTHNPEDVFDTIYSEAYYKQKGITNIHSSLSRKIDVYGTLPSTSFMESLEFSTKDLFKIARKAAKDADSDNITQLAMSHFGPIDIRMAW